MQTGRRGTARVGVITIVDHEFTAAQRALGAGNPVAGSGCFTSDPATLDVVLAQAPDRGNTAAGGAIRKMLEEFRPEVVVLTGIAGGIAGRQDIVLGDVVVADYLHYSDFRKLGREGDSPRFAACDHPSVTLRQNFVDAARHEGNWTVRIAAPRPADGEPKIVVGSIVAGEKIFSDPAHDEQRRVLRRFGDSVAIDMESYGAARAIHEARQDVDYNPLFLVIRGVSDLVESEDSSFLRRARLGGRRAAEAGGDNQAQRELWRPYAADTAAAFTAEVVTRIVQRPDLRADIRIPPLKP